MATARLTMLLPLWWSLCVSSALTPQGALEEWQKARVQSLDVDASRYHAQVLFVDDDNARARMAECCADALAHWADAGWWIYPHSCSLTEDQALRSDPRQEAILTSLGFDGTRLAAAGAALAKEDLDAYDLVVCASAAVRDAVLALGGDESYETSVRLLEDFATVADTRSRALFDGLDDALAQRARSRQDSGELVVEGADAQRDRDGFDALLESTLVLTAALVVFLKDSFDASFVDSFNSLLRTHYDERHVDAQWAEAEPALRRHIVTGALDPRERERLFDAHMIGLRQRLGGDM